MFIYRIVLDAYDTRNMRRRGARVVTYAEGYNREAAMRRIGTIMIARDGTVSDDQRWPGSDKLPDGPYESRSLPEWDRVSIRVVAKRGTPRILWETQTVAEYERSLA